jgi:hypothetical protein
MSVRKITPIGMNRARKKAKSFKNLPITSDARA